MEDFCTTMIFPFVSREFLHRLELGLQWNNLAPTSFNILAGHLSSVRSSCPTMNLHRRDFIKSTLTASAAAAILGPSNVSAAPVPVTSPSSSTGREYYELRAYRLKPDAPHALLDAYLEKALVPALN